MSKDVMTLKIEQGKTGLFFVTSPDLHGLLVSGSTLESALSEVPLAMTNLIRAKMDLEDDFTPPISVDDIIPTRKIFDPY